MKIIRLTCLGMALCAIGTSFSVEAQQTVVYPARGQSAQQQSSDEGACYAWAKQYTGVDPSMAAAAPPSTPVRSGQRVQGAATGAAMGAVAGAIDGDAGHGAAIGAVAGTVAGGVAHRQQRRATAAQDAQIQAGQQQALGAYHQAWATCMQGRGYSVR